MRSLDILRLFEKYGFNYLQYKDIVLKIGDVCAIRTKNGKSFRRNFERALLVMAVANQYRSTKVLEFGTGRGFVTGCLSLLDNVKEVWTIDKLSDAEKIMSAIPEIQMNKIKFIIKNSMNLQDEDLPSDFDLVFIDGEHTGKAVKNDFKYAIKHSVDNAVVVFDDCRNKHKDVKKFIKSLSYDKTLVYTDNWIYKNVMIEKHKDADKIVDGKEFGSGQVILLKNQKG